jgi:hypothetical protein
VTIDGETIPVDLYNEVASKIAVETEVEVL